MRRRGLVVALSGVDCAGKSTQRELLMDALHAWRHSSVSVWTRAGYTPGLERAQRALRALTGRKSARPFFLRRLLGLV